MKISVIISTYNRPDALLMILHALAEQTDKQFQILIADDGSDNCTKQAIEKCHLSLNLTHVWQKDDGFRVAKIRNKAAAAATGEYLIFIDGDCVPRTTFIERHRHLARKKSIVSGNRILLTEEFSQTAIEQQLPLYQWSISKWVATKINGGCNRCLPFMYLPNLVAHSSNWRGVKTCNMAVWRDDFVAVNGFNEDYVGWGYEDSDLAIRLIRYGVTVRRARYAIPVIHLWHPQADRGITDSNSERLTAILSSSSVQATTGVSQYLKAVEIV